MVISKLWKDIHPKHIRVENNSICWKNIAPWVEVDTNTLGGCLNFVSWNNWNTPHQSKPSMTRINFLAHSIEHKLRIHNAIGLKTFQRINLYYIYTVSWLFYTNLDGRVAGLDKKHKQLSTNWNWKQSWADPGKNRQKENSLWFINQIQGFCFGSENFFKVKG